MSLLRPPSIPFRKEFLLRSVDAPFHFLFRAAGRPVTVPLELTFSITAKCANRCRTCRSMNKYRPGELALEEYEAIFKRAGFQPFGLTFTGGEPFFREDFFDIVAAACAHMNPSIINIRTCGDLPEIIHETAKKLSIKYPETYFVTWLSMDGVGKNLDYMRGDAGGAFESVLETFSYLNSMGAPNHRTGISVLLSSFNAERAPSLLASIFNMYPDMVSLSIACGSEEFSVTDEKVAPDAAVAQKALSVYFDKMKDIRGGPVERAIHSALKSSAKTDFAAFAKKKAGKCVGGYQSLYIDPYGTVKTCPHKNLPMGELTANEMSIIKVLSRPEASIARKEVRKLKCACPSDCALFSNIILSPSKYAAAAAAIM